MSDQVRFSIKYDGPALAHHEMDVRELAPALLALSDLIKRANTVLYGEKAEVQVNVRGNFKGGSFGVDLSAVQTVYEHITSLLSGQGATATANLLAILGAIGFVGGGGLIKFLKLLRGRTPDAITYENDTAIATVIETTITEKIEVDLQTGKLWQDRVVRQSLYQVVRPLTQEGIDVFASGRTEAPESVITKEEVEWFDYDDDAIPLNSNVIEQVCLIESPAFKYDNKWKLNNGATFHAVMDDQEFLRGIDEGTIRFGKGDRLRVQLEITQHSKGNKIETTYRIIKVLEHRIGHQFSM